MNPFKSAALSGIVTERMVEQRLSTVLQSLSIARDDLKRSHDGAKKAEP